MDANAQPERRGIARFTSFPMPHLAGGFELFMFALIAVALVDAALVVWLFVRGIAG